MKKNLSLVIGLALVVGAVVSFSEASRDAYHAYLNGYSRFNTYRGGDAWSSVPNLSERNGVYYRISDSHQDYYPEEMNIDVPEKYEYGYEGHVGDAYVGDKMDFARRVGNKYTAEELPYRPSTDRLIGLGGDDYRVRTIRRAAINFYQTAGIEQALRNYETEDFSLQLPIGWTNSEEKPNVFTSPDSSMVVSIVKYDENTCSKSLSFTFCAAQLSDNENDVADLYVTSRVSRSFHDSDTILNALNVQTGTYQESFSAQLPYDGAEKYITRFYAEDLVDGGVYMIQTVADYAEAPNFVDTVKEITDSFRIIVE